MADILFIGAGMIFYNKQNIRGLTTAAGIWATAAIGMAAGTGMYVVSACASVIIIVVQWVLHLNIRVFHTRKFIRLNVVFESVNGGEKEKIKGLYTFNLT